jgi:hypothetical protein
MAMLRAKTILTGAATALAVLLLPLGVARAGNATLPSEAPPVDRLICWIADGHHMQPTADLERFLVDRLGATGEREVVSPQTTQAILRVLGFAQLGTFSVTATHQLAVAADARWVLWIKLVARDVKSKKLLGVPYLFNHRRLDASVFFDVRLYDALAGELLGSKRLRLTDRGEGTWQVTEDERLDPAYNNDAVEIHERFRRLDWRAAALISGYCADVFRSPGFAKLDERVHQAAAAERNEQAPLASPAAASAGPPD